MTMEALEASIVKWDRNAEADTPADAKLGPSNCPLCKRYHSMFNRSRADCQGCPVSEYVMQPCCDGTPYQVAQDAYSEWALRGDNYKESFVAAAHAEADFLRAVLAAQYPETEE